jgi:hypothetical protein
MNHYITITLDISYTEVYLLYITYHEGDLLLTSADWLPLQAEFFNFDIRGGDLCILILHATQGPSATKIYIYVNIMTRSP